MKKSIITVVLLILVLTVVGSLAAFADNGDTGSLTDITDTTAASGDEDIYLYVGSPLLLSGTDIRPLDPENLDVGATVINGRTLVPLRALSEYFAAAVSYDSSAKRAVIEYDGKTYYFPIGEKKYFYEANGKTAGVAMDTAAMVLNQRTMVPLRAICQEVLGLKVYYKNQVIAVSRDEIAKDDATLTSVKNKIGMAVKAPSLTALETALTGGGRNYYDTGMASDGDKAMESASDNAAPAADAGSSSGSGFSQTNTQVEGIDEADIVKTDGKYIYIAGNNAVRIVKADAGRLSEAGTIKLAENKTVQEIYIDGGRLILVGTRYEQQSYPTEPGIYYPMKEGIAVDGDVAVATDMAIMPYYAKNFSFMDVYDISVPSKAVYLKGHEMEGSYQSSRKNGGIVYLITNAYPYTDRVLPMVNDYSGSGEIKRTLPLDDVMILPDYPSYSYIVISALDINDNKKANVEAIAASGYITYMNDHALYLAANDNYGQSSIIKFAVDGMNIGYAGSGKVDGYLLNQFSMDEKDGYLRVATSTWENKNHLFVLDGSLNVHGKVTDFVPNERIYSVRFMGDHGYVVTFRNMDPLFVFDLSDPADPKITGELTMPGFSNYLQPVGEDLILGIGQDTYDVYKKDANGKEVVVGTRVGGIKLSLFDVSDEGNPQEIDKIVIGGEGSYSEAFYNHKAVMYDYDKDWLAFDASIAPENYLFGNHKQGALVVSFAGNDLTQKGFLEYQQPEVYGMYIPYGRRVVYIGSELYYIQDGIVKSYDYQTLKAIDSLMLK